MQRSSSSMQIFRTTITAPFCTTSPKNRLSRRKEKPCNAAIDFSSSREMIEVYSTLSTERNPFLTLFAYKAERFFQLMSSRLLCRARLFVHKQYAEIMEIIQNRNLRGLENAFTIKICMRANISMKRILQI
ncbi:hypothetical protein DBV15_06433 [Temnothorax longispinosus]|uniref:Uncharacterized protein n=1 Tax=Temnothorax longispinosus TaxID=300112 RepID=A0A4S2KTH6_9HYME|nr:hypothetical protein DBV15_06433 [Temnothorax longispinosus]